MEVRCCGRQYEVRARLMRGALLRALAALTALAHSSTSTPTSKPGLIKSSTTTSPFNAGRQTGIDGLAEESPNVLPYTRAAEQLINFSSNASIKSRKHNIQVAPVPLLRHRSSNVDTFFPIPGRLDTQIIRTDFYQKQNLKHKPGGLEMNLNPSADEVEALTYFNRTKNTVLESENHKIPSTTRKKKSVDKTFEFTEWNNLWPTSYTDTVQSFTVGEAASTKGVYFNVTFLNNVLTPNASNTKMFDPFHEGEAEVVSESDYSGEPLARVQREELASSLKSLMARNQSLAADSRQRQVDLVLSSEAALVQLWPQFGDLLEQLLHLASETCKNINVVPLISQYADSPKLRMIEYSARGRRVVRAEELAGGGGGGGMVVVYVPGWWNTPGDAAARALRAALVAAAGRLLLLDTRAAFCRSYLAAAAQVPRVADALARWLLASGVAAARLHLLGFSLGAHVAAQAALRVRRLAGARLARVSALEPAAPCLRASGWRRGATHVQVVHTSRSLALRRALGHADVYARVACAPGCQHAAAWRLFAASARRPAALRAHRCQDAAELERAACAGPPALLGYPCKQDARGIFFLTAPANATYP